MGGMVVSRSMQMLAYLPENNELNELVQDKVKELVLALEKIEKLLNTDRNSMKVMENMEKIRDLAYSIEDALEIWAVHMELACMPNNDEKKRGILRFLRRCFGRDYGDDFIMLLTLFILMILGESSIKWLHDTFPDDVLESEHSVVIERRMANHRSLRWPRPKYDRGVEEHFVEMKEELNKLISLVAEDKEHRVVSIWGVKGLGKTTLARKVYIHHQVRGRFKAFAWVSLDQDYEIGSVLQNILNQLGAGAVKKSAEEKKKNAEDYQRNRLQIMKKLGGGAVKKNEEEKKEGAEEQEKGAEEKKKLAEVQREGTKEKIMVPEEQRKGIEKMNKVPEEKKEIVEEKIKGTEEEKEGAEEKRKGGEKLKDDDEKYRDEEPKEGVEKKEKKEGVEENRKGDEEQKEVEEENKECAEEKKEGVELQKKGAEDHKKGAEEQKNGIEEKKEGAEEIKKGAKKLTIGNLLQNMMKLSAGSMKKSADEHINTDEENKEGDGEQKEGAEEKKRVAEEKQKGDEDKKKEAGEKKKCAEEKNKGDMEKKGGPEERNEGVEKHKKGIEEQNKGADKKRGVEKQKKGAEESKEGVEEKRKGAKDLIIGSMMKLSAVVVKKSIGEHKQGEEEKDEGAEENNNDVEEQQKSSEEEMLARLKDTLRQKSCLVVIDGISELSQWTEISSALVMEDTDTKFLLTTDDETIASEGHSYSLRLLNEDEGWELLQKYVFRGKTAPDLGVVPKLGKEMVGKCGYLPSKISSLGRTLSAMSLSDWHKVNDNVTGYLQTDHQSISNERLWDAVDPQYDHLSYSQKQRFLYLAIFKEDEDVDPEDVSFLWMGEGMVPPQPHDKDKEGTVIDTAEFYLQELARKGMLNVKVDELSANRRFLPFSLHNHARQLSLHQGEKEDFRLKVVDFSGGKQPRFDPYTLSDGTRRLAIHFNKLSSPGERNLNATDDLRSLLFLNSDRECVFLPVRISDFKEFTLLRVLHFVRCRFEDRKLPEGIWKLLNLMYFGLLYCDLDELPQSISNLRNLHVLNVRSYDDAAIVIPKAISELTRLKHLRLPHNSNSELKLDGLDDLETLVGFNADKHNIDNLSTLKKLRYLGIHASSRDSLKSIIKFSKLVKSDGADIRISLWIEYKCDFTSPEGLAILEELLLCPNLDTLTFSMVLIYNFPNCGTYASPDLTQIKLIGCKLIEDPMEALGKFPNLRKLCLGYGAFVGKKMAISDKGFSKLEDLEFRCLPNLEEWIVDEGALQKLSTLTVKRCPKLKSIPEELASVSTLKNMEIELEPSVNDNLLKTYLQMFAFVKSRNISKVDPLSAGSSSAH